ncbi:long-chain fatty acid--CoA ligase, partial [Streptomyces sp. MCAF7]
PKGVRADWDGDGEAEAYALLQLADDSDNDGSHGDETWTGRVNAALADAGFPPVTRALRMKPDDVAKGATGKVLKRVIRDRFAAKEHT